MKQNVLLMQLESMLICFHNMVSRKKIHIIPRKGEYCLLDKSVGSHVSHTVFALPGKFGKGVLVTPTVHGNLLIGPTAQDIENKEGNKYNKRWAGSGIYQILQQRQKYSDKTGDHIFCRSSSP